ncbi:MAG: hypothetical protein BM549_10735 [Lacinutrix sp. MedPE-SW]|nr:MAG: hypothetical protein BM549_10735 [Lacinutrix sp. MedPE-SW]
MLLKNYIARENLNYFMIALYYLYYLIFEYTTGQTIGKIITKTKVVNIDNDLKPSFSTILLRTLCRLIPFEIISYLFSVNGLHDRLSKTTLKNI